MTSDPGWEQTAKLGTQTPPPGAGGESSVLGQLAMSPTPLLAPGGLGLSLGVQTPPPATNESPMVRGLSERTEQRTR